MKTSLAMPDGRRLDSTIVAYTLSALGWKAHDHYAVLVTQPKLVVNAGGGIKSSAKMLEEHFRDALLLSAGGAPVLVVRYADRKDAFFEEMDSCRESLDGEDMRCGVSAVFRDFALIEEQYAHAKAALDMGRLIEPEQSMHFYESLMLFHVIKTCSQTMDIRQLCSEKVMRIHEYDQKHGSDLTQTLYIYLLENKSLLRASERMHTHRNTMVYRLAKINEIADIDMKDGNTRQQALFSCTVLQYIDAVKKERKQGNKKGDWFSK